MNEEKLFLALGEIDEAFISEAAAYNKKVSKRGFWIVLSAALLVLLSVSCYAAIRWHISLEDIFGEKPAEIVENFEQPIAATETKDELSVSLKSTLADGRIVYLLWQIDSKTVFQKNADVLLNLSFGKASVDTSLGYYSGVIQELRDEHVLAGYVVADWNKAMQNAKGTLSFDGITVPVFHDEQFYEIDFPKSKEMPTYENGIPLRDDELWSKNFYPAYKGLNIPVYELGGRQYYIDSYGVEDDMLYITTCAKFEDPQSSADPFPVLYSKQSDEEIKPEAGPLFFMDKNGFMYWTYAYKTTESLENLCYYSAGSPSIEKIFDLGQNVEFSADASLESVKLPCSEEGIEILCSTISMAITGKLPSLESIQVFLDGKDEVELIQTDPERIIFAVPIEPERISSILINGKEYLS